MEIPAKIGRLFAWLRASYPNSRYSEMAPPVWASELCSYSEEALMEAARACLKKTKYAPSLADMVQALEEVRVARNATPEDWTGEALPPAPVADTPKMMDLYRQVCRDTDARDGLEPEPEPEDKTLDTYRSPLFGCTRREMLQRIAELRGSGQ